MPARPDGGARPHPAEILQVPLSASREEVEEAYLHCIARLRSAFLDLGGFDGDSPFHHNHSFETFVAGAANRLALSSCRQVGERPGADYNPLYLYGRPGLGKTHLLNALHARIRERSPQLLVVSTTAERFTEELLTAMGNHSLQQFHGKYRQIDVLLMDSFHAMSNRLRTQEELCAVLDNLTAQTRQVVIASQSPPKDSSGLLDSLRSRLSSGLVVEIAYPDLETRKAIIRLLAGQIGVDLSRDVVFKLAHRIQHDVRELKGAVTRLAAHHQSQGALGDSTRLPIDELLYDLAPPAARNERCCLEEVLEHITAWYQLDPSELLSKKNAKKVRKARQIAMYLARQLTNASLQEIADALEASSSQVLYAVRTTEKNCDDPLIAPDLEALYARLKQSTGGRGGEKKAAKQRTRRV